MATKKYYRKSVPQTPCWLSKGIKLIFSSNDRITGYYATENDFFQEELGKFIAEKRGGVVEITADEYDAEYVKKKGIVRPPSPILTEFRAPLPPDTVTPTSPYPSAPSAAAAVPDLPPSSMEPVPPAIDVINKARPRVGRPPGSKNKKAE